jgi:flavin reductase (DIM6/NTAB) family NADH-FMN oxidoreductase RutF
MFVLSGTVAWFSVDDEQVCLLNGFTAACYTPPTIMCAASALPPAMKETLRERKVCTLSAATVREPTDALTKAGVTTPTAFFFHDLGLTVSKSKDAYPVVVATSPIQMFCTLDRFLDLGDNGEELLILTVESFRIDGSILSPPTEEMKTRPGVVAKIDAALIQPIVALGDGRFSPLAMPLRSMPRPRKMEDGSWQSPNFDTPSPPSTPLEQQGDNFETVEWSHRE